MALTKQEWIRLEEKADELGTFYGESYERLTISPAEKRT